MKRILLILFTLMLLPGIAMAAPILDIPYGHSILGLSYWNPALTNSSKSHSHEFIELYGEAAVSDKIIVGLNYSTANLSNYKINSGSVDASKEFNIVDVSLNYKVNHNVQLIAGDRFCFNNFNNINIGISSDTGGGFFNTDYNSTNTFFYGAGVTSKIGVNDAYASILHSNIFTDKQVGVNFNIKSNLCLNVNYRQYQESSSTLQGFGGSLAYKF